MKNPKCDIPNDVFEQLQKDTELFKNLATQERRALVGQVASYWKLARRLPVPGQLEFSIELGQDVRLESDLS